MNCSFGPYQITSGLDQIEEFVFSDPQKTRQVVISSNCDFPVSAPCDDAIVLYRKNNCPTCDMLWYDCPSDMGRKYTILPTPCGVTITSFEDGIVISGNCNATKFGSEHFCFGKIYSNVGEFEASDKSVVIFDFDGNTFTVKGTIGVCPDLLDCSDCGFDTSSVETFAELPTAPTDTASSTDGTEEAIEADDIPETKVLPGEGRASWTWDATTQPFGTDTLCEDEKSLTKWATGAGGTGNDVPECFSDDNPSIVSLPSGHTAIAYERRRSDGLTKISVAILSTSVRQNIRYYRALGKGTLLNNFAEKEGVGTFEVYDEMRISSLSKQGTQDNEKIGFLTGPLAGKIFAVTKIKRTVDGARIKNTFSFLANQDVKFPDKNNAYDVQWFLLDDAGSADLPSSSNIVKQLDLPHHTDPSGTEVPVAHPSISVAQNNLMTSGEQNIYVAYQAFENNQWRVYLREIILGGNTDEPPIYLAPYLFNNESQTQVEIMSTFSESVSLFGTKVPSKLTEASQSGAPGSVIFDEAFNGGAADGSSLLQDGNRWRQILPLTNSTIALNAVGCIVNSGASTCHGSFPGLTNYDAAINPPILNAKTVYIRSDQNSRAIDDLGVSYLRTEFYIRFRFTGLSSIIYPDNPFLQPTQDVEIYPAFEFRINKTLEDSTSVDADTRNEKRAWKIKIYRGIIENVPPLTAPSACSSINSVFIFELFNGFDERSSRTVDRTDVPNQRIKVCIPEIDGAGDYKRGEFNIWRITTFIRGRHIFFECKLSHSGIPSGIIITTLRAINEVNSDGTRPEVHDTVELGTYYGFGFDNGYNGPSIEQKGSIVEIARIILTGFTETIEDVSTFHEDWFDIDENSMWYTGISSSTSPNFAVPIGNLRYFQDVTIPSWTEYSAITNFIAKAQSKSLDSFYTKDSQFVSDPAVLTDSVFMDSRGEALDNNLGLFDAFLFESFAELNRNEVAPYPRILDVSIYIRVTRDDSDPNSTTWPTVWFLLRRESGNNTDWAEGWRVRVRHYDDPDTSVRKWRVSLYDGDTTTGVESDVPIESIEVNASLSASLSDVIRNNTVDVSPLPNDQAQLPYLRVDCYEVLNNKTQIDVYVAARTSETVKEAIDNNRFKLIHSFSPVTSTHVGREYGLAIFSGARQNEFTEVAGNPHSTVDFRSTSLVDYVSLQSFSDISGVVRGACCRVAGGCEADVLEGNCQLPDIFHASMDCLITDCGSTFPLGAVCRSDGICVGNITETEAIRQSLGTCTACGWQEGKNCNNNGNANYRDCPDATVTGSCCYPAGGTSQICSITTFSECAEFYGDAAFFGNSVPTFASWLTCAERDCWLCRRDLSRTGEPGSVGMGACHSQNGTRCRVATNPLHLFGVDRCGRLADDVYQGDCTNCVSHAPNTTGACCNGITCTIETEANCFADGRTFLGRGTDCSGDNPCPTTLQVGACCYDDGICSNTIESACLYFGTWFYDSTCADDPCPDPTGACCDSFGQCEDSVTQATCFGDGNVYYGHSSVCSLVTCIDPVGACCIGEVCTDNLTESECVSLGGNYRGNTTNCIANICTDLEDPYGEASIIFKPEDLWTIEFLDEQFVTRVLYHMQEERLFSNFKATATGNNAIDFMFVVDYSGSMQATIINIANAIPELHRNFRAKGLDVRFGFVIYGRSGQVSPVPTSVIKCLLDNTNEEHIFNAFQSTLLCRLGSKAILEGALGGFVRDFDYLQRSMFCWGAPDSNTTESPWAAINFALDTTQFSWRSSASKFILLATDAGDTSGDSSCGSYANIKADAEAKLVNNKTILIPVVADDFKTIFSDVAVGSGWNGTIFNIDTATGLGGYEAVFNEIVNSIDINTRVEKSTVIERAKPGTDKTFLKKAEAIITYNGDLSDLWTFNKSDFEFRDNHVPFPGSTLKELINTPFDLASGKIYGIDPIHIQGLASNWVSFGSEGDLNFDYPNVGTRASATTDPILIANNSTRPKVFVNNRNQVIVAYESYSSGTPQIELKGTGDFHQDSLVGPKASRIHRFLVPDDFSYNHTITLPGDGMNQICDFIVDNSDITHIVWQSNIDGNWEIYYANSSNLFIPVRITKSESKSLAPSISVDDNGSIFVVYHDNRFGPFEIMLASKDEERIIPLIEQDAYLASMSNKYTHYTNILPVILDNPSTDSSITGQFWGTKLSTGAGNDNENAIYKLNEVTGVSTGGADLFAQKQSFIEFSSTSLYGVNADGVLSTLGTIADNKTVILSTSILGTVVLDLAGFTNQAILDMAVDQFDRIWILIYEEPSGGGIARFRLLQINKTASTILTTSVLDATSAAGSLTVTSDNKFYLLVNSGGIKLFEADYPLIGGAIAQFSFTNVGTTTITPQAMTHNSLDTLFVVTDTNDLYTIDKSNASAIFQISLTSESGVDVSLPVGTTSGIAFQQISGIGAGSGQFLHVRVDFYDNIAFEGEALSSIDSRKNLEAFINEETTDDPYVFGLEANGIFLNPGEFGIIFFDSSHFVPGYSKLSQPFTFEPNQTYFPRVFAIDSSSNPRKSGVAQPNSFSCTKCSRFGNNNFNSSACTYSFISKNETTEDSFFNYLIDFFADASKQHIIRRFELTPGSPDLQYAEIDNKPAVTAWKNGGLLVAAGDAVFVQINPVLDPTAGFLCGVQYAVDVRQCFDANDQCSEFTTLTPDRWDYVLVKGSEFENITTTVNSSDVMLGLSMSTLDNDIILSWISTNNLKYARYNGKTWDVRTVSEATGRVRYCSISTINNKPAILYTATNGKENVSKVLVFDGSIWTPLSADSTLSGPLAETPRELTEFNDGIIFVFPSNATTMSGGNQWFSGTVTQFDGGGNVCGEQGGCSIRIRVINDIPSIVYVARNQLTYAKWNGTKFDPVQNISAGNVPIKGVVDLAGINGQPSIAYLVQDGILSRLMYKRFTGSVWSDIDTLAGIKSFGKHVAIAGINNDPVIAYTVQTGAQTSELWAAVFNGAEFVHDLIEKEISIVDPVVDIVEFNNRAAIVVSANPFKVYFFKQFSESTDDELNPVFFCECSSKIFTNRLTHLNEVDRWESSAHGFADTRVTESTKNSFHPVIKTRVTGAAIILWEDSNVTENCLLPPCIRAAAVRNANQDQLRSSGTGSWFDYDFGISGKDPSLSLDIYDRVNVIYEKPILSNASGFYGRGTNIDELPENELFGKICDFTIDSASGNQGDASLIDTSALEANVITFDKFISEKIVRKIIVKNEFVEYYTYNASGVLTPIVSNCNIILEIHGTPEIVAVRIKNEDNTTFGDWCAWSPQISDFIMQKKHKISGLSGIKQICIQAMTYAGITSEFCVPIIADYETVVFETNFYADSEEVETFKVVTDGAFPANLDKDLIKLPMSEGLSVANISPIDGNNQLPIQSKVLIEIIASQTFDDDSVVFDVIQQGANDIFGLTAIKGKNNIGRVVFRGDFTIEKEDNTFNTDGLARVIPAFPSSCKESDQQTVGTDNYSRDSFNVFGENVEVETLEADPLSEFRQQVSGRVGVTLDIRGLEDPYFIFGDPNYELKKTDGRRLGVPFTTTESEIQIGDNPDGSNGGGSSG